MAKKFNPVLNTVLCILFCVVGFFAGAVGFVYVKTLQEKKNIKVYTSGDLSFHFLELGNNASGDCTYVKAGDVDILIDAGSEVNSITTITAYINQHITDGKLEYVIVTHAHSDHYAGFATGESKDSIFDLYEIGTIIDFSKTNQQVKGMYKNYLRERQEAIERGATHSALDCINQAGGAKTTFEVYNNITLTILNQKYYTENATTENNYSVCTLFSHGERNFLFTGDLEKSGEVSLVELNNLPKCELFKAGHHGSYTSSNIALLEQIQPEICVVCCCAGNYEHADYDENNFPSQDFVDRISIYTDRVYVTTLGIPKQNPDGSFSNDQFTSMNGNVVITSSAKEVSVECSNNNTKLKDTQWFKEHRTWGVAG